MSYMDWKDKAEDFKKMDVRGIQGNFFPGLKKQASGMNVGDGFEVIQSFDPIPLYEHSRCDGYQCDRKACLSGGYSAEKSAVLYGRHRRYQYGIIHT